MALKLYLFGLFSTLVLAIFLLFVLILSVNPFQAPVWIILLFYFTIFLVCTSSISLISYYAKGWIGSKEVVFSHLWVGLRKASIFALVLTLLIFFEQIKILNWWVASLLIFAFILLELFFRSRK